MYSHCYSADFPYSFISRIYAARANSQEECVDIFEILGTISSAMKRTLTLCIDVLTDA